MSDDEQADVWEVLYTRVREVLQQYGEEDYLGGADYHVLGDNYGFKTINVAFHRLEMLRESTLRELRMLLSGYPDWAVLISIDVPGKESTWPRMGITIRSGEIVDELKRQYFPKEFQSIKFS